MEIKNYELTLFGKDVSIMSNDILYATNANGKMFGIQTNITENKEEVEKRICEICERIHENILKLTEILEVKL